MLNLKLNYLEKQDQNIPELEEACEELEQIMYLDIETSYVKKVAWKVEFNQRSTDSWQLEEVYNKLLLRGQKCIAKYIHLKRAIKKSKIVERYMKKKGTYQEIYFNKDIIYEFPEIFSIENSPNFMSKLEYMNDYQKIYDKIYYSFYKKINLKALDFHYIWKLFTNIIEAKDLLGSKKNLSKILESDKIENSDLENILTNNLENTLQSIDEFIDSKIKVEDYDKEVERKLKEKQKKSYKKYLLKKKIEKNK